MKAPEVLIVEDEKLLRLMIAKLLQVSGYRVFMCRDSLQALELVEKKSFDLVITDLMMAGATGMDVLRATRKCQPRAKVIIITGTPSSQTLLEAKREGAYAYLRKPFQLKQFLSIRLPVPGKRWKRSSGGGTSSTGALEVSGVRKKKHSS
jgi:DNA-binding NtrC family response regulator